jgi:hypothetical protein
MRCANGGVETSQVALSMLLISQSARGGPHGCSYCTTPGQRGIGAEAVHLLEYSQAS